MNGRVPPVASNMRPARAKAYQRSYNETFASEVYAPGSIPENDAPFSNTRMPGCCCCSSPLQGGCTLLGEAAAGSNVLIDATAEDGTDTMMDVDVTTVREASAMDMDVSRATSSVDRVIDVSEQGARVFHPIGSVSSPTYINTKNEDAYDLGRFLQTVCVTVGDTE
ncbi:hypothetical protein EVJ58_g3230 [Rhodofomes roseus]|uniref:Uncharacterized protein n=1 Tax=Rhodofomes roseus TaxID=34475 RepID=A0A4Y9YPL8_9APHY|nr:hypothetical protein EVJ58_g3230 [Rhodofomes roseus]